MFLFCLLALNLGLVPADAAPSFEREAYAFPFADHQTWVQEMAGKGLEDWSQVFNATDFERFQTGKTVGVEKITYVSDGLKIKGFLIVPKVKPGTKLPLIIFNRGGTLQWSRITFWEILEFCRLAERGYVVAASYFRGCGGSDGEDSLAKGDVRDVLQLIRTLETLPAVDASRIGMWGFSRGSITTYHCLMKEPRIKAAVIAGGVSDALRSHRHEAFDTHVYPRALPGYKEDKPAALLRISAYHWASMLPEKTPVLLLHGGKDQRVKPEQALFMAEKFEALGRPYQLLILQNATHSLIEEVGEMRRQVDTWFDRHLAEPVAP